MVDSNYCRWSKSRKIECVCVCGPHATPYIKLKNAYAWIHLAQCINIQMSKKRTKMSKHPEKSGPKGAQNLLWEHEKLISFARQILVWQCVGMLCATIQKCVCYGCEYQNYTNEFSTSINSMSIWFAMCSLFPVSIGAFFCSTPHFSRFTFVSKCM